MWRELPLANLAAINSGGTPSTENADFWGGDIPWVTPTDITACKTNYLFDTANRITKSGLHSCSAKLLPAGSILFTSRATVGVSRIAGIPVCTNQGFKSLTPSAETDGKFLYYQVQRLRGAFERYAAGSTFPEINKKDTARVLIPHPTDVRVQQKIATILSTIDTAIEQTEALIEKYQHIKAGLMHDLFTRGVLPNGQLRPPREQAPELYQETAIGWIPREWEAVPLDSVLSRIDAGWSPECQETPPGIGEWGVLKVSAVTRGVYDPSESKVLPQKLRPDPSIEVSDGDVILTRANGVAELVGVTVQVKNTPANLMLSDKLLRLVPVESLMTKNFLTYVMQSNCIKSQIDGVMSGSSGQRNIAQSQIREFICNHPTIEEQVRIDMRLSAVDDALDEENRKQLKLQKQKLGLMQDLLTGKVPVVVDSADNAAHA